jgi:hypothetical protein
MQMKFSVPEGWHQNETILQEEQMAKKERKPVRSGALGRFQRMLRNAEHKTNKAIDDYFKLGYRNQFSYRTRDGTFFVSEIDQRQFEDFQALRTPYAEVKSE